MQILVAPCSQPLLDVAVGRRNCCRGTEREAMGERDSGAASIVHCNPGGQP